MAFHKILMKRILTAGHFDFVASKSAPVTTSTKKLSVSCKLVFLFTFRSFHETFNANFEIKLKPFHPVTLGTSTFHSSAYAHSHPPASISPRQPASPSLVLCRAIAKAHRLVEWRKKSTLVRLRYNIKHMVASLKAPVAVIPRAPISASE